MRSDRSQLNGLVPAIALAALLVLSWAQPASAACDNGKASLLEDEIAERAMAEALKSDVAADLPVEDLTVVVLDVDGVWEVTFQDPDFDPNMFGDNVGFLVRLGQPCGHLLELLRYQ